MLHPINISHVNLLQVNLSPVDLFVVNLSPVDGRGVKGPRARAYVWARVWARGQGGARKDPNESRTRMSPEPE